MNGNIKNVYVNLRNACLTIAFSSQWYSIINNSLTLIILDRVAINFKLYIIGFLYHIDWKDKPTHDNC